MPGAVDRDASGWLRRVARYGWLAKGSLFVLIGLLALQIAVTTWDTGSKSANQQGALRTVAAQPLGGLVIAVLAVGLAVFAIWNLAQAVLPGSTDRDLLGVLQRIGWAGLGLFYGLLSAAATGLAVTATSSGSSDVSTNGSGNSGGSGGGPTGDAPTSPRELTASLLDHAGGRWLVAIVALVVLAVALYHLRKGLQHDFVEDLATDGLSDDQQLWLGRFGAAGFVARAFVLALVGWFLLKAAVTYDASEAVGLDGALRRVAELAYGRLLLGLVSLGLVVAGVYDMVTFRRQRLR